MSLLSQTDTNMKNHKFIPLIFAMILLISIVNVMAAESAVQAAQSFAKICGGDVEGLVMDFGPEALQQVKQAASLGTCLETVGSTCLIDLAKGQIKSQATSVALTSLVQAVPQAGPVITTFNTVKTFVSTGSKLGKECLQLNKEGMIESGSMKIKQPDGTEKNIDMKNMKYNFDEKKGVGTYTFGKGGYAKMGDDEYKNVDEESVIYTDKSGNIIGASLRANAEGGVYKFPGINPIEAKNLRIDYQKDAAGNGKARLYGKVGQTFDYSYEQGGILSKKQITINGGIGIVNIAGNCFEDLDHPGKKTECIMGDFQIDDNKFQGVVGITKDGFYLSNKIGGLTYANSKMTNNNLGIDVSGKDMYVTSNPDSVKNSLYKNYVAYDRTTEKLALHGTMGVDFTKTKFADLGDKKVSLIMNGGTFEIQKDKSTKFGLVTYSPEKDKSLMMTGGENLLTNQEGKSHLEKFGNGVPIKANIEGKIYDLSKNQACVTSQAEAAAPPMSSLKKFITGKDVLGIGSFCQLVVDWAKKPVEDGKIEPVGNGYYITQAGEGMGKLFAEKTSSSGDNSHDFYYVLENSEKVENEIGGYIFSETKRTYDIYVEIDGKAEQIAKGLELTDENPSNKGSKLEQTLNDKIGEPIKYIDKSKTYVDSNNQPIQIHQVIVDGKAGLYKELGTSTATGDISKTQEGYRDDQGQLVRKAIVNGQEIWFRTTDTIGAQQVLEVKIGNKKELRIKK